MQKEYYLAAKGLKNILWGQLITILGAIAMAVGALISAGLRSAGGALGVMVLSLITMVLALVLSLMGMFRAAKTHRNFRYAVIYLVASFVLTLIAQLLGNAMSVTVMQIMKLLQLAASFGVVYFICRGASALLEKAGNTALAKLGDTVRMLYLIGIIIQVVCSVAGAVVIRYAQALTTVYLILQLLMGILYLIFLGKASKALDLASI